MTTILSILFVLGSLAQGMLKYADERDYGADRWPARIKALNVTLFWWLFRSIDAWHAWKP